MNKLAEIICSYFKMNNKDDQFIINLTSDTFNIKTFNIKLNDQKIFEYVLFREYIYMDFYIENEIIKSKLININTQIATIKKPLITISYINKDKYYIW